MARHAPDSELYRDKDFVPSWREDVRSLGFNGFYRGFPIIWHRKSAKEGEGQQTLSEPVSKKVIAVDLKGWQGIRVKKMVFDNRVFGDLTIRTWTEKEVEKALDAGTLESKDVDRAKGNCPVEVSLHWALSSGKPPKIKSFEIKRDEPSGRGKARSQT